MPPTHHLLIPFAACQDAGCREALAGLRLPALQRLLARLVPEAPGGDGDGDGDGNAHSLSMPHERALARMLGLWTGDGRVPWAAWQLAQAGQPPGDAAWAWLTPCHWRVGRDHIVMEPPAQLQLQEADSQGLLEAMRPYFEQDGITLAYEGPTLWRAQGEPFRQLACASLDRVSGRVVDAWLPRASEARTIRRLQQEMQMLLYTHAVNDARQEAGLAPVNSFWVSGAGALPPGAPATQPAGLHVAHDLREPALRGDWTAWTAAWQALDAGEVRRLLAAAERGEAVRLTLCGDSSARTWRTAPGGWWRRFSGMIRPQPALTLLSQL